MKNAITKRLLSRAWWLSQLKSLMLVAVIITVVSLYQQRTMVSGEAPLLIETTLTGQRFDLSEHYERGPVMVYFWGSWCGICSQTSPAVSAIAADVTGSGRSVVSVALASGPDREVQAYLDRHGYGFLTVNDDAGTISQRWGVTITPSFFYLNPKGEVVLVSTGLTSAWGMRLRLWIARFL